MILPFWPASEASSGVFKTVGRISTSSSLRVLLLERALNKAPSSGMSCSKGTPLLAEIFFRINGAAEDDAVAVLHRHIGRQGFWPCWALADAVNVGVAGDVVNFLVDLHHHQTVGIDEWRDVQCHTDRELRVGRADARGAAVVSAGHIRHRVADEERGRLRLESLDARLLDDGDGIVGSRRLDRDVVVGMPITGRNNSTAALVSALLVPLANDAIGDERLKNDGRCCSRRAPLKLGELMALGFWTAETPY